MSHQVTADINVEGFKRSIHIASSTKARGKVLSIELEIESGAIWTQYQVTERTNGSQEQHITYKGTNMEDAIEAYNALP